MSRLLLYSAGLGVNRVQVVLSGLVRVYFMLVWLYVFLKVGRSLLQKNQQKIIIIIIKINK